VTGRPAVRTASVTDPRRGLMSARAEAPPQHCSFRWRESTTDARWTRSSCPTSYVDPDPEMERRILLSVREAMGSFNTEALLTGEIQCSELLTDPNRREMLAEAYRDATRLAAVSWRDVLDPRRHGQQADRSRMNRTTLSLFSGPLTTVEPRHFFRGGAVDDSFGASDADEARDGWLLLGDATLADDNVLQRLVNFFGDHLPRQDVGLYDPAPRFTIQPLRGKLRCPRSASDRRGTRRSVDPSRAPQQRPAGLSEGPLLRNGPRPR
jgi:hypothetical protein